MLIVQIVVLMIVKKMKYIILNLEIPDEKQ